MISRIQNILLGVVLVAFVVSDIVLLKSNSRLRDELGTANSVIVNYKKTAFDDDRMASNSAVPPEIFLYNYSQSPNAPSGGSDLVSSIKPIGSSSTPGTSLLALKDKYLGKAGRSQFTLFVFFSPTDCPACLLEASIWQRLQDNQRSRLQVMGIMNHPHKLEGEQFLKNLGITFPVLFDNTGFLKNKYRIGETPEKVLIDSEGKTLHIAPGSKTEEEKRGFEESVLKLLSSTH